MERGGISHEFSNHALPPTPLDPLFHPLVEHDGSDYEFSNYHGEHPRVFRATMAPGATVVGCWAFYRTSVSDLSALSSVLEISRGAFATTDVASLSGLPPGLLHVGWRAFGWCGRLSSLRGLPFAAEVERGAFAGCRLLHKRAKALGCVIGGPGASGTFSPAPPPDPPPLPAGTCRWTSGCRTAS